MSKEDKLKNKVPRVVNPRFAKDGEYRQVIGAIGAIGLCPFCPDNFRYHKKPILKKSGEWILTENSWPYKNAQKHFIIIAQNHKERLNEIRLRDLEAILRLSQWAIKKYHIRGGALAMRFGESDHTGATVHHIHAHLISPILGKDNVAKTVNFPIG